MFNPSNIENIFLDVPVITLSPSQPAYREPVVLSCSGLRIDTDQASIRWLHDNRTIRWKRTREELDKGELLLAGKQLEQEGQYSCSFINSVGKIKISDAVKVQFKGS